MVVHDSSLVPVPREGMERGHRTANGVRAGDMIAPAFHIGMSIASTMTYWKDKLHFLFG